MTYRCQLGMIAGIKTVNLGESLNIDQETISLLVQKQ